MKLQSSAFAEGAMIPAKYTCAGSDVSPPLSWNDPPTGTQSLALIVDDPDAPAKVWVHWVIYNLPAETKELPEDFRGNTGAEVGTNDFRRTDYGGPCPPSGTHRYQFKLYALDTKLHLSAGASKEQLLRAMEGHVLDQAQLTGKFAK